MDIFEKCRKYTVAKDAMDNGYYPYFRMIESPQEPEITINGKKLIMIGSNNYLGLTNHPKVKEAAIAAIRKYGTGCAGSRFLNGNLKIHEELEEKLANFFSKEAAIVFATGFQTNLGAISALVEKGDAVIIDKLNHASIIDGCRLSFGDIRKYRHSDIDDLERVLSLENSKGKLIVIDGVFSMEGDIAPLPQIVELKNKYDTRIMVDDAHGIGVLGKNGKGTAEHFNLEDEVDIIMGTYSKTLATIGGVIASSHDVVHYIRHHARSLIFSASLTPASVSSASVAIDVIQEEPERREKLWENTHKMKRELGALGYNTGNSETPIIPVILEDEKLVFKMTMLLHEMGVFVNPIIPPAVAPGKALIRTSYMATHTTEQLDRVTEAFCIAGKRLGVI